jgi:hypothetical protein
MRAEVGAIKYDLRNKRGNYPGRDGCRELFREQTAAVGQAREVSLQLVSGNGGQEEETLQACKER